MYFQVIAYNDDVTPAADEALAKALQASHSYYLATKVNLSDAFGPVVYYIWVKGHKPAQHTSTAKAKAKAKKAWGVGFPRNLGGEAVRVVTGRCCWRQVCCPCVRPAP